MLASMLLMVAGMRSWSDYGNSVQKFAQPVKSIAREVSHKKSPNTADDQQATVSALSLDAVITPAISFDFSHYFYFAPQPVWHFIQSQHIVIVDYQESYFLFSCFSRVFARYIVTNAP
jgi:hypothetical protein